MSSIDLLSIENKGITYDLKLHTEGSIDILFSTSDENHISVVQLSTLFDNPLFPITRLHNSEIALSSEGLLLKEKDSLIPLDIITEEISMTIYNSFSKESPIAE